MINNMTPAKPMAYKNPTQRVGLEQSGSHHPLIEN
jgi:hypothetical protein